MKAVIFYWTRSTMYYVSNTNDDSDSELIKRLDTLMNQPGVIGGFVGYNSEIPDFAVDMTDDYE